MSACTTLELALRELLQVLNPTKQDCNKRLQVIDDLRGVVNTVESLRGATVEPFGSFLSNLFTRWGDLDISIELSNGSYIVSAGRKHKQTLLGEVFKALCRKGLFVHLSSCGMRRLQFVSNARVPIVKFEMNYQSISCDVSINNLSGQMKSKSLLWISFIDPRFREMVLLVKEWANSQDINNPKTGTFNSYSLSLLVVFHFQTCDPAILPPLKELYPRNMADELTGIRAVVENRIEEVFIANVAKFKEERKVNHSSLAELFITFLGKFSDIGTRAANQGICVYTGKWETISSNMRWLPRTYSIFIEDPFEQPENSARAVSRGQLTRISEVFKSTCAMLAAPNANRISILHTLVRPDIFLFLFEATYPSSAFLGYPCPNPVENRGKGLHTESQYQHQFQKIRLGNHRKNVNSHMPMHASEGTRVPQGQERGQNSLHPSKTVPARKVSNQKHVQAIQGQEQQVWRPKVLENSDR